MKRLQLTLLFLVFLTSSFDIAFNLNLGGFNIRTCYFINLILLGLIAADHFISHRSWKIRILGLVPLLIWAGFQFVFAFQSTFLNRTVGYFLWLIFNLLMVEAIRQTVLKLEVEKVLKWYLVSFGILAVFGMVQFMVGLVGIKLYTAQWWILNHLPRINGLCYEPSYYSSYMLIGWVLCYFLTKRGIYLFSKQVQIGLLALMGVTIFLATSRMGIAFVMVILGWDMVQMLLRALITKRISVGNLMLQTVFVGAILGVLVYVFADQARTDRYLQGTGIRAGDSYSRDERMRQMEQVLVIFKESPIIGYSLGGISPAIAKSEGEIIDNQKDAKKFEGLNIYLEVLAASGIFGFIFFVWFFWRLLREPKKLINVLRSQGFTSEAILLGGMFTAMISEMLILALNQNILRPYLWIAIGLTNALYFKYLSKPTAQNVSDEKVALH